ncbi:MAG: HAD-IA family hydrolase [Opitutaceae bacterium]|nr:HAD-IA family hydrolase [Opitutaceae bacterium]
MSGASRYAGVVFDLDGTLIDSMPQVLEGLASAVGRYRPRPALEEIMGILGGPSEACVRRLLAGGPHVAAALAAYLRFLRSHEHLLRPFRGALPLLRDLHAARVRLGLWTGRERASTVARLQALSVDRYFDQIVCGDDLPSHKPEPSGLLQILRAWKLAPDQVLFVGDSDQDVQGGREAGMPMVAIAHHRVLAPGLREYPRAIAATPTAAFTRVRAEVLRGRDRRAYR